MKLFWKQFVGILCLVLLVFSVFGSFLLYSSFQMSLKEEKNRITEEISMFQYAILSSIHSLPKDYEAVDYAVGQIGRSIVESLGSRQDIVKIYQNEGKLVYESTQNFSNVKEGSSENELSAGAHTAEWKQWKENEGTYRIQRNEEEYFLQSLSLMESSKGNYYLEINRNISHIYENREMLYQQYKMILLAVIAVSAFVSFIFSMGFTRPILRLSKETRVFAAGNYESRVKVSGNDEVTALMEDFNEMADKLQENMTELQDRARQQEEFTAAFAHELKTPLTSIIGYADMLRMMELSEEDRRMCGNYIFQQGKRLESLSHKMLELVGMDRQRVQLRRISVKNLMKKTFQMMEISLREKDITWTCKVEDVEIPGDEDLLLSLFCNLIDNSRKACEEHGRISCYGTTRKRTYVLTINDNGRGIPGEELEKVKEAFYMVDKSRARREGGAGIGMALCEKIIHLHKGSWRIESRLGEGTKITVCLPFGLPEEGVSLIEKQQALKENSGEEEEAIHGEEELD